LQLRLLRQLLWLLLRGVDMKVYVVKNTGLAGTRDYRISLEIDREAETVKATLAMRVLPSPDPEIKDQNEGEPSYADKDSVLFAARELRAGRDWSERQAYLAGFDWLDGGRFRAPVPLSTLTQPTRFSAADIARHIWNGNFLVGLNVPFTNSTFDECFVSVNLGQGDGGCVVSGLADADVELTQYSSSGNVREMVFPSVEVKADTASVKAGEPATFSLQMLDGLGDPTTRDAELYLETVNGFLPVVRRRTQDGKARATVLTTGMQAGDTVRLKAGFKFYPGADDAEVTLT
jgi:hypothetical protein